MRCAVTIFLMACALAGCRDGPEPAATASPTTIEGATPAPSASASPSNGARAVSEETDDFLFKYSYPAEAGRITELAALLDSWLEKRRGELATESAEARRQARGDGFPYNKHSYAGEWKVVADLPGWLSLSAEVATYTGGAHGNYTVESLVWDKDQGKGMDAKALFTSTAALEDALGERFCDALDRQRAERRDEPVPEDSDEPFDRCPDIDDLEVLVGSSNHRTFNRLTLYAGPYVAGAYAEGAYEIDLPVDRAVLAAVRPEYRSAFTARN